MDEPCLSVVMKSRGGKRLASVKCERGDLWRDAVSWWPGGSVGLLGVMFPLLASGGEGHVELCGWPPGCKSQELCYQIRLE